MTSEDMDLIVRLKNICWAIQKERVENGQIENQQLFKARSFKVLRQNNSSNLMLYNAKQMRTVSHYLKLQRREDVPKSKCFIPSTGDNCLITENKIGLNN